MGRFVVVMGDITKENVDAIVNAANTSLLGGGGVDGAIHRAAGSALLSECRLLGGCETGKAKITKGYGLPAKHVIHTPGPVWRGGTHGEEALLESCYRSCMGLAAEHSIQTLAFPSISTGVYRFPPEKAARIAVNTIFSCMKEYPGIKEVKMVCFDDRTKEAYDRALQEARNWETESGLEKPEKRD
ncbi:MAG: O-acetyl-ADP-ribose deacetylase [Christensenella sp.]|nr:O-acetyl-ADP-ribose deacetylase [Christensenella sp.]